MRGHAIDDGFVVACFAAIVVWVPRVRHTLSDDTSSTISSVIRSIFSVFRRFLIARMCW